MPNDPKQWSPRPRGEESRRRFETFLAAMEAMVEANADLQEAWEALTEYEDEADVRAAIDEGYPFPGLGSYDELVVDIATWRNMTRDNLEPVIKRQGPRGD